jgi:hypothetical protein
MMGGIIKLILVFEIIPLLLFTVSVKLDLKCILVQEVDVLMILTPVLVLLLELLYITLPTSEILFYTDSTPINSLTLTQMLTIIRGMKMETGK